MQSTQNSARRDHRRRAAVALALALMAATACGNRLSEERLKAAAGVETRSGVDAAGQPTAADTYPTSDAGSDTTMSTGATPDAAVPGTPAAGSTASGGTLGGGGDPAAKPSAAASGAGTKSGTTGPASGAAKGSPSPKSAASPGKAPSAGASAGAAPRPGQADATSGAACSGSKAPIVIGSVGEYSGLLAPILVPGVKSVQGWVSAINAKGGLNCHPVKYVVYDAGGDPARNQALTQRAVEQDKVIAFVYSGAVVSGQGSAEYLKQRRIPIIGEEGAQPWICYSPMGFSVMSSCNEGIQGVYQVLAEVVKPGERVAAITCNEVPFCAAYTNNAQKYATEAGFKLVYNGSVSLTQPDYTSACIQANNAGAQALVLGMDNITASRLRRSCKGVGLDVPIISNGTAFTAAKPGDGLGGAWMASGVRFTPPTHPGVAEWLEVMKQYVPGTPLTANGGIGWVSAKVFEVAAKTMPDTPSSQAVLDGLWTIKGNDIGGMTRPLTYLKDQPAVQTPPCWFADRMEDNKGGWTGDTRICL